LGFCGSTAIWRTTGKLAGAKKPLNFLPPNFQVQFGTLLVKYWAIVFKNALHGYKKKILKLTEG